MTDAAADALSPDAGMSYRVELDAYAGPMDLLLYLVRKHEINLLDLPMAQLTEQYLAHLDKLRHIDLDLAAEFLVMASTLLEVKAAMLAPQPVTEQAPGEKPTDWLDPRAELVRQLLAYKAYRDAADDLARRMDDWQQRFAPGNRDLPPLQAPDEADAAPTEVDIEDVTVTDLCAAFGRILESVGRPPGAHEVVYDDTPIALHAEDIVDRLTRSGDRPLPLADLFTGRTSRSEMIGLFLAVLELVRQRRVAVEHEDSGDLRAVCLMLRPPEETQAEDASPSPAQPTELT